MCTPLINADRMIGAMLIDRPGRNCFDRQALTLFTAIAHMVGNAIALVQQIERLHAAPAASSIERRALGGLLGESPEINRLRQRVAEVAESDEPVLIVGERGTFKDTIAETIHRQSPRADCVVEWFHCMAADPDALPIALFGENREDDETDQPASNPGKLELAHGGTLIIEEIGALPPEMQAALLGYLQTLKFKRIGSERRFFADVRIIATTCESLDKRIASRRFDAELHKVLSKQTVRVPPLRDRANDVVQLALRVIERAAPRAGRRHVALAPSVMRALMAYPWPGNVRELECIIERAVCCSQGRELRLGDLPPELAEHVDETVTPTIVEEPTLREAVRSYEREIISDTLRTTGGDRHRASQILEISIDEIEKKLHDQDLDEHPPPRKGSL
jgi:DNA-binding NtrC family response regulator